MSSTTLVHQMDGSVVLRSARWRPARAGLVNVWRYLEETFEFHGGRLLLRGPNGSGKSMALELLFPFLLDANASPTRLSSAAKSRGGLYDRIMTGSDTPNRVGYVWAEFLRDAGAGEEAFTVGARLRASTASAKATTDWFTTSLRVGGELPLLDEARSALSRKQLAEALGEHGTIHASAEEYRTAVRTHLFPGYSEKQYDAVITALLALRREKLSQDLTPARLSEILTSSLPPVDEHDIAEIAEGFEKLDRRRDEIAALERDREQIRRLVARQRSYACAVLLAQANSVRAAETRRDDVTKRERRARADLGSAKDAASRLEAEQRAAAERLPAIGAEVDTLENLDAYRAGSALGPLREESSRLEEQVRDARRTVDRRERAEAAAREHLDRRREEEAAAEGNETLARRELDQIADRINAAAAVERVAQEPEPDASGALLTAWSDARRQQLHEVRTAARGLAEAVTERRIREERLEEDRAENDRAVEERVGRERGLDEAREAYADAVRAWIAGCRVLAPSALGERLPLHPIEPKAVRSELQRYVSELRGALAVRRADLERRLEAVGEERAPLEEERALLAAGRAIEPDAPAWRSARDPGAVPLWRLVDFRDDCPTELRAGIEAALLAAGLLDALVAPDGRTVPPDDRADLLFGAATEPVTGPSLADVLAPVEDAPVPSELTARLLRSVTFGHGPSDAKPASVGHDGSFQLSVLAGRGRADPPRFIGAAAARERERARRIHEIDEAIAALAERAAGLRSSIDDADREVVALEAEAGAAPDGAPLDDAVLALEGARRAAQAAEARVHASQMALRGAEERAREAQRRLAVLAARHSLPTDEESLAAHAAEIDRFDRAAAAWMSRRRDRDRAREAAEDAERHGEERSADLREARDALDVRERQAREVRARLDALERSVGAEYQEIVSHLSALAAERHGIEERRRQLEGERLELAERTGRLERDLESAERERVAAEAERDDAHRGFVAAVIDGLARDAETPIDPAALEGVSAVLESARAVAQRVSDAPADPQAPDRLMPASSRRSTPAVRRCPAGWTSATSRPNEGGGCSGRSPAASAGRPPSTPPRSTASSTWPVPN